MCAGVKDVGVGRCEGRGCVQVRRTWMCACLKDVGVCRCEGRGCGEV